MIQQIYQTVHKTKVSLKFIEEMDVAQKNKLVNENVVQSTIHFSKRIDKIFALLSKESPFVHDGVQYAVEDYFRRTEYQMRGAPHEHVMLWLRGTNGEKPPSMWDGSIKLGIQYL